MVQRLAERVNTEFLIIGSGIAGLSAAIRLSEMGKKAVIVTKSRIADANTYYAQGGLSVVEPDRARSGQDSYDWHISDTLKAGDGLCNRKVVELFVKHAYGATKFLENNGVEFSRDKNGDYVRHQEGGHSAARIWCVGDYTGRAVEESLAERARNDPNITILENHTAVNLITGNKISKARAPKDKCLGAYVLDRKTGKIRTFTAGSTFLATGGAGRAFLYTSNPENATGDGIAMAYRAGARIANMEFFQFHPTVLYDPNPVNPAERRFLLTEALRGKAMGGILTLSKGSLDDFVKKYIPDGSSGTRDKVSQAIDTEMKKGIKNVWLNVTPKVTGKTPEFIKHNYPDIYAHCLTKGIDITKEPIPVVPAAHYTCGGIVADKNGMTDISNLYAIGEVSSTGLMGANRLASNSLPECAYFGILAVEHALKNKKERYHEVPLWDYGNTTNQNPDQATLNQFWDTIRATMMNLCGIDRNEKRLAASLGIVHGLSLAADIVYWNRRPTHEIMEVRNLALVSEMIARAALNRRESRGSHYRSDFPHKNDKLYKGPTIISKAAENMRITISK